MATVVSFATRRTTMAPGAGKREMDVDRGAAHKTQSSSSNSSPRKGDDDKQVAGTLVDGGAESDVDELMDSDTENVETNQSAATTKGGRGKGKGSNSSKKASAAATTNGTSATTTSQPKPSTSSSTEDKKSVSGNIGSEKSNAGLETEASTKQTDAPNDVSKSSLSSTQETSVSRVATAEAQPSKHESTPSREVLGRTATGGPVPYYYAKSNVQSSSRSPQLSKQMTTGYNSAKKNGQMSTGPYAAKPERTGRMEPMAAVEEDLTMQEVDKFLDLIEKYDLDTSNEDVMARSVNELYQEWLEWCAKRNVNSTKSKQSLVAEFPRIHQGEYGSERQQRAIGIVQRHQSERLRANAELAEAGAVNGHGSRIGTNAHAGRRSGSVRDDGGVRSLNQRGKDHTAASSRVASPASIDRQATASAKLADDAHIQRAISPRMLDMMHRQIRDEIWKETSMVISQMMHEQMADVMAENRAMASRIEQLEAHSDNLAQWVQHLNRVQEEQLQSRFDAPPPGPPQDRQRLHPRDEAAMEAGRVDHMMHSSAHGAEIEHPYAHASTSGNAGYHGPPGGRAYASHPYEAGGYGHPNRSVSPVQPHVHHSHAVPPHHGGHAGPLHPAHHNEAYARQGNSIAPPSNQHPAYANSSRRSSLNGAADGAPPNVNAVYRENAIRPGPQPPSHSGAMMGPAGHVGGEGREDALPYYRGGGHPAGPIMHDDRMMGRAPMDIRSTSDGRQAKRARNGMY